MINIAGGDTICLMDTPGNRLRHLRAKAGYASAADFARAHGIEAVTYRKHESGDNGIRPDVAERYGKILGSPAAWILYGDGNEPTSIQSSALGLSDPPAPYAPPEQMFTPHTIEIPATASLPLDIPVYGTVVGGVDADFEMNGDVVDRVRRPPGLAGAKNAFGLYVVGESMERRYMEGDLIFVHPGRKPTPGCDVVVEMQATDEFGRHKALLKQYRGRTPTKLLLYQFNPEMPVEISLDQVMQVFRVLTTAELLGM